jgi:hypothetical protein
VGGEHRPQPEVADVFADLVRARAGRGDPVDRLREPGAVAHPDLVQLAAAVHLLGDVGQVEVRGEGAHDARGAGRLQAGDQGRGRRAVVADRVADMLDQLEQVFALLPHQRLAEQHAELVDIAPQFGLQLRFAHARQPNCETGGTERRPIGRVRQGSPG